METGIFWTRKDGWCGNPSSGRENVTSWMKMELQEIPEDKSGTGLMPGAGPHRYSGPAGMAPEGDVPWKLNKKRHSLTGVIK